MKVRPVGGIIQKSLFFIDISANFPQNASMEKIDFPINNLNKRLVGFILFCICFKGNNK